MPAPTPIDACDPRGIPFSLFALLQELEARACASGRPEDWEKVSKLEREVEPVPAFDDERIAA